MYDNMVSDTVRGTVGWANQKIDLIFFKHLSLCTYMRKESSTCFNIKSLVRVSEAIVQH